jgi:single-stranded DNA-binding protein
MSIECAFFGTLGKDAEIKTSASGKTYVRLNVRVGDGDGAQWVSVLAFDSQAVELADKLVQGARLYVEGRLELSEWTGRDGAKRQGLNVMSWHCRLPHIGRNRPKKKPSEDRAPAPKDGEGVDGSFYSDPVPF